MRVHLGLRLGLVQKVTDVPHPLLLLCAHGQRPRNARTPLDQAACYSDMRGAITLAELKWGQRRQSVNAKRAVYKAASVPNLKSPWRSSHARKFRGAAILRSYARLR